MSSTNNVVQFRKPAGRSEKIQVSSNVDLFTVSTIEMLTVLQWLEMQDRDRAGSMRSTRCPNDELGAYLQGLLTGRTLLWPVVDVRADMLILVDELPPFPVMQLDLQQAMNNYFTKATEG